MYVCMYGGGDQILHLDISKQFKRFTAENGYRSPLCLAKLINFAAAPDKVAEDVVGVVERPLSAPAGRMVIDCLREYNNIYVNVKLPPYIHTHTTYIYLLILSTTVCGPCYTQGS